MKSFSKPSHAGRTGYGIVELEIPSGTGLAVFLQPLERADTAAASDGVSQVRTI